jgi:hypothetical protein
MNQRPFPRPALPDPKDTCPSCAPFPDPNGVEIIPAQGLRRSGATLGDPPSKNRNPESGSIKSSDRTPAIL